MHEEACIKMRHPSTTSESCPTEEDARQGASAEEKDCKKLSEDGKPMIYELIWKWIEALLAKQVPDGTKALVIHQFVFQAKTISTTMRRMVLRDKLVGDVMTLLRQTGLHRRLSTRPPVPPRAPSVLSAGLPTHRGRP